MKKPVFYLLLSIIVIITVFKAAAGDIYVSPKGNDRYPGTQEKPLATLHAALRKAREWRRLNDPSVSGGIRILLAGGRYELTEPVLIRPEDSGSPESPTQILPFNNEKPVLSGGITIGNWKKVTTAVSGLPKNAIGKVWVAETPVVANQSVMFRQLWVNGNKATRARDRKENEMDRILSWDFNTQTCTIPLSNKIVYSQLEGAEMLIHQWWAIANLRIRKATVKKNKVELFFMQPESRIQAEHPWPSPWISDQTGNSAFYLTNALQFLDEPGEWYEDLKSHKVYYWPRKGEDLPQADVTIPFLENLVKVSGTADRPVQYLTFKGITFQHATWLRPSRFGHVPLQAGMYLLDAYKLAVPGTADKKGLENQAWVGRPAAAIVVNYAKAANFEDCTFEKMASTGLDYYKGTQNSVIKGNLFRDIGGSGILMGEFSDEQTEAHLPYLPLDERDVSRNNLIENNLITNVTNEDWGCVGIGAGYVQHTRILNNEINEVSYSGISLGWGWTSTPNVMKDNLVAGNKIHHYGKRMYDVAGIYTLSAQPGTVIEQNLIDSIYEAKYAHLPDHWFYLYTDEGTSGVMVKNNWTPSQKYLQNANGPGNTWQNNGSQAGDVIRQNAGLQLPYRHLLQYTQQPDPALPVNIASRKVIVEMVFTSENDIHLEEIKAFSQANQIPLSSIYRWKNHIILYITTRDPGLIRRRLEVRFQTETTLYDQTIYDFNRKRDCSLDPANDWDHVILSANLVDDKRLQQEYITYHAEQFTKWPELSKGFCNAEFQQLVIYKSGRQLMLVISIPKGKSLAELNPKTTVNNPRVDEWNALMKKYQEGISGTKPGEVWVFFELIR